MLLIALTFVLGFGFALVLISVALALAVAATVVFFCCHTSKYTLNSGYLLWLVVLSLSRTIIPGRTSCLKELCTYRASMSASADVRLSRLSLTPVPPLYELLQGIFD